MLRLNTITAAAGAGKTTRIVNDIADEVLARSPEQILATTFTIKAADELVERARAKLFEQGNSDAAARLLGARFGTVNAVCSQIVNEFAIDLGRSPSTNVIDQNNESLIFSVAADAAIAGRAELLNRLAERFGYNEPQPPTVTERPDWRKTVLTITALARANGLDAEGLRLSAERSVETFAPCFPTAAADGAALDAALAAALQEAIATRPEKPSAKALKHLDTIRAAHERSMRSEQLNWSTWARLAKIECAPTKDGPGFARAVDAVIAAAGRHGGHPGLRADCEIFTREIFLCAAEALSAYQGWKAERGMVDFTDQEALALEILQTPALAARVKERIGRVFVDEFQDSSPLQLAVFAKLAETAEASTWVGDPKQAIYGFRGADTELTQAAFLGAGQSADPGNVLAKSWRSRPSLVQLFNAMFTPVFERMGLPAEQHAFSGAARAESGFDRPAAGWWWLLGTLDKQAQALAEGIRSCLEDAADWLVEDDQREHRALRSGDIAVLCRSNVDVGRLATALSRAGLPVAVERTGLADTPHIAFVLAACRWVADPLDRLALAELARFFASEPDGDGWLRAASAENADDALRGEVPIAVALERLSSGLLILTPCELVDAVLAIPEVMTRIERWGDTAMRFDDLEALRGFSRAYEEECAASGAPATLRGMLLALVDAEPRRPPSLASDAIQVMTYHGAKGLEWPMTILTGLAWEPRARLFEPVADVTGDLSWQEPLANRWIRYWPWPYGLSGRGGDLEMAAFISKTGQKALRRAIDEDTRLLYVGATRARDYLVFAPPAKSVLTWLKVLDEPDAEPLIAPPQPDDNQLGVGSESFSVDARALVASDGVTQRELRQAFVRPRTAAGADRSPLFLRPSDAQGGAWHIRERIELGARLAIDGTIDVTRLGDALHAIIGYDDVTRPRPTRLADAEQALRRWTINGFSADDALTASERLSAWADKRWPGAQRTAEVPIIARSGHQLIQGRIDMLVNTGAGFAIIDHKSFPGRFDLWEGQALKHAPQLGTYAAAIQSVTGQQCEELWIHMPVVGALFRLGPAD